MDNDEALDVQYHYFEKYNAGKSPDEIYAWFQKEKASLFEHKVIEDSTHFWLGLALCQWEVKALEPFVAERVNEIVESDIEKEDWEEEYLERKKVLEKFLVKISKEKKTAKKPVKQRLFKAAFEKGDVITYPIYDLETKAFTDTWGLAVCVVHSTEPEKFASSLFVCSGVEKPEPATMDDFMNAYALAGRKGSKGIVSRSMHQGVNLEPLEKIRKIGKTEVARTFEMNSYSISLTWFFPYAYDFVRGGKHDTTLKMTEAISIPDHPYSEWGEKILYLRKMKSEDQTVYKETADFLIRLWTNDETMSRNAFTSFIAEYLFTSANQVQYMFRSIVRSAGYPAGMLE